MGAQRRSARSTAPAKGAPATVGAQETQPASKFAKLVARLKTLKGAIVAIAGVGAVLGGLTGYWDAYKVARLGAQSAQVLELVGKGDAGPLSIVVLPFANLTGDPQQAYLADGLTAAITADLSRIHDAFVVSAATAFMYKDKALPVQQVGKALGVRFALHGSVQRNGDKLRINAQLAETGSQAQLWSESFDGTQADIFTLQDLVTTRIANSIGPKMVVAAARETEVRKSDPKATDLLLQASAIGLRPRSQANFEEQQALYRRVLTVEPNNQKAMVALAQSLALQATDKESKDPAVEGPRQISEARELALRAKQLDPQNEGINEVLASYAASQGDMHAAVRIAEDALARNPKDPKRLWYLSKARLWAGQCAKSIELMTQIIKLDPRDPAADILFNMSFCLFVTGESKAAIDWMLKAKDKNPYWLETHVMLAMAYAKLGDMDRSRAARDALLRADPTYNPSRWNGATIEQMNSYDREYWETVRPTWRLANLPE